MRYKKLDNITQSDVNAFPIINNGTIYLSLGAKFTNQIINRLKDMGYSGLYVYDDLSDDIDVHQSVSMKTRMNAVDCINRKNVDDCVAASNMIFNEIIYNKDLYSEFSSMVSFDDYTSNHCVNVSIMSGGLGAFLGFSQEDVYNLVLAGLLHDLGKTQIDKEVLFKPGKLTKEEYEIVKTHSRLSYEMIKDSSNVPATVKAAVLEHHENYDGTGYPMGLKGEKIYKYAHVIHIVDVYDAMVNKRCYKSEINPADVIEHIEANSGAMFNPEYILKFVRNMIVYPNGCSVKLSNGETAVVVRNNKDFPIKPIVRTENGTDINLLERLNVTITAMAM